MYNTLSDIKQSLQFKAVDLDLDDTKQLSSGLTPYEEWLTDMAEQSKELNKKEQVTCKRSGSKVYAPND